MDGPIYFDNAATTPVDPRVNAVMRPFLDRDFGNPSSLHRPGREARAAVDLARQQTASLLNSQPRELIFTASGTEADNLALLGIFAVADARKNHLIVSAIEHPAVLATARFLATRGVEVSFLPVDEQGLVSPDVLRRALRPTTRLVSIMAANNVLGTLQPISELGRITREHGAFFHTDAVQAVGKIPFDVRKQPIDLLTLSAHKFNGPKGVGALYVRQGIQLSPIIHGGGQEQGLRSATENVAGIVGLGRAAQLARIEMADEAARLVRLRDRLIDALAKAVPNAHLHGHRFRRLPGHVCFGLEGQEGEAIKLLLALDEQGIAVSSGSACSAHHGAEPSYVLLALGLDPVRARGSLRISLGRFNTDAEVDRFIAVFPKVAASLRSFAHQSTVTLSS